MCKSVLGQVSTLLGHFQIISFFKRKSWLFSDKKNCIFKYYWEYMRSFLNEKKNWYYRYNCRLFLHNCLKMWVNIFLRRVRVGFRVNIKQRVRIRIGYDRVWLSQDRVRRKSQYICISISILGILSPLK